MKFGYTIIYVQDVPTTLSFYEKAFDLKPSFVHPDGYAELTFSSPTEDKATADAPVKPVTKLAFAAETFVAENLIGRGVFRPNRAEAVGGLPGIEISLIVDEKAGETVEGMFKKAIAAGGKAIKAPATKPWGQTVGYVADGDGVIVEIATPVQE